MSDNEPVTAEQAQGILDMFKRSFDMLLAKDLLGIKAIAIAAKKIRIHLTDNPQLRDNVLNAVAELGDTEDGTDQFTRRAVFMAGGYYLIARDQFDDHTRNTIDKLFDMALQLPHRHEPPQS